MGEKKDYKEFQTLLRKGIGSRSQKEFAEAVDISAPHLNRMLNNEKIARPSIETIKKLVDHIRGASLNEFLIACGYDPIRTEDLIVKVEEELELGIEETKGNMIDSIDEFLDLVRILYLSETATIRTYKEFPVQPGEFSNAEFKIPVDAHWEHEVNIVATKFFLYYVKTSTGKMIVTGSSLSNEENKKIETDWKEVPYSFGDTCLEKTFRNSTIKKMKTKRSKISPSSAEMIFENLLSEDYIPTTRVGYGFYYEKTPEGFKDFLINHASTFCNTDEKLKVYQEVLKKDSDVDKIFNRFYEAEDKDECCTGMVVAEILRGETGMNFYYYGELDENNKPCVMFKEEQAEKAKNINKYSPMLFSYAKELKLPTFGLCYYQEKLLRRKSCEFNTEKFYFQMR